MKEYLNFYQKKHIICVLGVMTFFCLLLFPTISQARTANELNSLTIQQQATLNVRGVVVDASGIGLPGATVRLVSSQNIGTVTDVDGNYVLNNVPSNGIISFSFVGYSTVTENVNGRSIINITLHEDSETLDDVVVVAYGTQKKATLTGAVAAISTKEIKQSPTANMAVTLTGRLPGLIAQQRSGEPGRDETLLFMRGRGTINGQAPLVLVEGQPENLWTKLKFSTFVP